MSAEQTQASRENSVQGLQNPVRIRGIQRENLCADLEKCILHDAGIEPECNGLGNVTSSYGLPLTCGGARHLAGIGDAVLGRPVWTACIMPDAGGRRNAAEMKNGKWAGIVRIPAHFM